VFLSVYCCIMQSSPTSVSCRHFSLWYPSSLFSWLLYNAKSSHVETMTLVGGVWASPWGDNESSCGLNRSQCPSSKTGPKSWPAGPWRQ
jgi:hypothetical protein